MCPNGDCCEVGLRAGRRAPSAISSSCSEDPPPDHLVHSGRAQMWSVLSLASASLYDSGSGQTSGTMLVTLGAALTLHGAFPAGSTQVPVTPAAQGGHLMPLEELPPGRLPCRTKFTCPRQNTQDPSHGTHSGSVTIPPSSSRAAQAIGID